MVLAAKFEIIVCLIHAVIMVTVSKQLRVISVDVLIHIQAPIVNKVCMGIFLLPIYELFSSDYHYNNHDYYHHSYCNTSTLWFKLCMYCHSMSANCCLQSMYTQSMVSFWSNVSAYVYSNPPVEIWEDVLFKITWHDAIVRIITRVITVNFVCVSIEEYR